MPQRFPVTDPRSATWQKRERAYNLANLNFALATLRHHGDSSDISAAALGLWCIAGHARKRATEKGAE